jgi:spermidine/putrescine transport system permease protein
MKLRDFHFLIAPPLFWLILFFVVPMVLILICSLSPQDIYGGVQPGFTLEHYKRLFDPIYLNVYLNSLLYAVGTTVITAAIAYPMAYFMAFASPKTKAFLLFLVMLPFWTNFLVRTYSFIIILAQDGLINTLLLKTHLIHEPLDLLYNQFAVYVGFIYGNLPFMLLPLFSALDRMPQSHLEASMDLGAGPIRTFWKITFPNSIPGLAAGIIFVFIPTFGNFIVPEILGGTDTIIIGNIISRQFLESRNWPFGSAMSAVLVLMLVILISIYIRYYDPMNKKNLAVA